jgi:hypothetical protein
VVEFVGGDRQFRGAGDLPHEPLFRWCEYLTGPVLESFADSFLHLLVSARPSVQQLLRDAVQFEVPATPSGAALHREPQASEFPCEFGPVALDQIADGIRKLSSVLRDDERPTPGHSPPQ